MPAFFASFGITAGTHLGDAGVDKRFAVTATTAAGLGRPQRQPRVIGTSQRFGPLGVAISLSEEFFF